MYVESSTDEYYCRFIISALVATTPWQLCRISADDSEVLTILLIAPLWYCDRSTDCQSGSSDRVLHLNRQPFHRYSYASCIVAHPDVETRQCAWMCCQDGYQLKTIRMACGNAPEDGTAAAIRRARLAGVWATDNIASAAISCRGWHHIFWLAAIDESGVGVLAIDCHIFI